MSSRGEDSQRSSRRGGRREAEPPAAFSFYDRRSRSDCSSSSRRNSEGHRQQPRSWYDARDEDLCKRSRSRSRERPTAKLTRRPDAVAERGDARVDDEASRTLLRPAVREDERSSRGGRSSPRQHVVLRPKPRADGDDRVMHRHDADDSPMAIPRSRRRREREGRYRDEDYHHHHQQQQHYIILKNVPPGTDEAAVRSRFRQLGERPINVDHFPAKGVSFVYFHDERECVSALKIFQTNGSKMRENDDAQVSAMLVPAAKNPPRARELACQIERSQRDNVLRAAVEEYDYEETRRKTRSLAMGGINSDMWHSYLEDGGSSERQMRVPKPKEGHALPYCKCMVYDEVAEHYYDEDRNWAYNPRTGFWYHRDGVYYTYYEPLGVLVGYAKDSPVRALPGETELSEEQEDRIRKEISRMTSGLPSQAAPSAHRTSEIGDGLSEGDAGPDGRESRSKPSKVQSMSDDGKLQRGNEAGLPVVGGKKGQRTTEAERSSLGSSKLASIYFNPNQFGTMSLPRLPPQEQKTRLQPQSVALETAPAPLASEPVILSKQPLGETRKRLVSSGGDGKEGAICMLCQRRFNSVELLLRHEKLSKMHKANLEKEKKQSMESQEDSDSPPWRKAVK